MGNQKYTRNHGNSHWHVFKRRKQQNLLAKQLFLIYFFIIKLLIYLFSSGFWVVKLHYKTVAT